MSYSLAIDPETRDVVFDDEGQVVYTTDPSPELVLAIGIPLGSFHGDPDQGSTLPSSVSGSVVPRDTLPFAARDALARLERSGVISVRDVRLDGDMLVIESDDLSDPFQISVEA